MVASGSHSSPQIAPPRTSQHDEWIAIVRSTLQYGFAVTTRNVLHWLSWVVVVAVEVALTWVLRDGVIYAWERDLTREIQRLPARSGLYDVTNFITNTLSLPFAILFVAIVLAVLSAGYRVNAAMLLLSFPLHVLAQFPKALIDRPRPSAAFAGIDGIGGFRSFPSGHAEFVVSFYGFLTYLALQRLHRRWQRISIVVAWIVLAVATGLGRIATGRHWPIDIAASYLFGAAILSGLIWLRWSWLRAIVHYRCGADVDESKSRSDASHLPSLKSDGAAREAPAVHHQ